MSCSLSMALWIDKVPAKSSASAAPVASLLTMLSKAGTKRLSTRKSLDQPLTIKRLAMTSAMAAAGPGASVTDQKARMITAFIRAHPPLWHAAFTISEASLSQLLNVAPPEGLDHVTSSTVRLIDTFYKSRACSARVNDSFPRCHLSLGHFRSKSELLKQPWASSIPSSLHMHRFHSLDSLILCQMAYR